MLTPGHACKAVSYQQSHLSLIPDTNSLTNNLIVLKKTENRTESLILRLLMDEAIPVLLDAVSYSPSSYEEGAHQSKDGANQDRDGQGNTDKLTVLFFCEHHRQARCK